jgi:hypothetical protein
MLQNAMQVLVLSGRVCAFILGSFSFYLAFFLYEDEEGVWQNRMDELWVSIHDRAKATDSFSTALMNAVARMLFSAFEWIFGKPLFSIQMLCVSLNLSIAGGLLAVGLGLWYFKVYEVWQTAMPDSFIYALVFLLCAVLPAMNLLRMEQRLSNQLRTAFTSEEFAGLQPELRALVNSSEHKILFRWTPLLISSLPVLSYIALVVTYWLTNLKSSTAAIRGERTIIVLVAGLLISLVCDVLSVALIRKVFASIATSVTSIRMLFGISILIALMLLIEPIPVYFGFGEGRWLSHPEAQLELSAMLKLTAFLNITTTFYCILPAIVLIFLLVHRVVWPALSRGIYPLSRYHVLVNQKVMALVGCTCFTVAFNLEYVGAKELLQLFGK